MRPRGPRPASVWAGCRGQLPPLGLAAVPEDPPRSQALPRPSQLCKVAWAGCGGGPAALVFVGRSERGGRRLGLALGPRTVCRGWLAREGVLNAGGAGGLRVGVGLRPRSARRGIGPGMRRGGSGPRGGRRHPSPAWEKRGLGDVDLTAGFRVGGAGNGGRARKASRAGREHGNRGPPSAGSHPPALPSTPGPAVMAVEGGMKCVKFLLYVLLLAFCVSGKGDAGGARAGCGETWIRRGGGRGAENEGRQLETRCGRRARGTGRRQHGHPTPSSFRGPRRLVWPKNGQRGCAAPSPSTPSGPSCLVTQPLVIPGHGATSQRPAGV